MHRGPRPRSVLARRSARATGRAPIGRIRRTLAARGLAPSRARGQNFLRSARTAEQLVELAGVARSDAAIEIGAGLGELTRPLARVARRVLALEVDRGLLTLLREAELAPHVEIREADALAVDFATLCRELGPPVVLLGNLPYRIAGRLLGALLAPELPFRRMALMLQSEVADRVVAGAGTADYGPLAVWAGLWTRAETMRLLSPEEFEPRPKVRSAFVVFEPRTGIVPQDLTVLRQLVRTSFQHRRKTLRGALRARFPEAGAAFHAVGLDPLRRGETLEPAEFVALADAIAAARGAGARGAS